MNSIRIGTDPAGNPIELPSALRRSTHTHVIGGSGKGKSKFLQWMIERDIREGHGFCLIDWHGTLYRDVLQYCAHLDVGVDNDFRSLVLLNPSEPTYITGFNPFMNQGADVATQVSRRIEATIRPWGITDTNLMPTFERLCRLLFTFAVERGETLPNAAHLLQFNRPELREYAISVISDPYVREQWQQLAEIKSFRDWKEFVLSTENRLSRFLASKTIRRFMGMTQHNLNLRQAMDEGKIVLVNLGSSSFLDRETARVFASLLLNEFFETTMLRANSTPPGQKPKPFVLYLDEFQEYITEDIAAMLDQVRKGGLHLVLAHQHLAHLAENRTLLHSVLTNARIRAVFGGLSYDDASLLANEMFLPDLNSRQIKQVYYHTVNVFEEQTRLTRSKGSGEGISKSTNWSRGQGYGNSLGTGTSALRGSGTSSALSGPVPGLVGGVDQSQNWLNQSQGQSAFAADSSTVFSSDSTSEFFSEGESVGKNSFQTEGTTEVPFLLPVPVQELTTESEWTREEKISRVCEMLKYQNERHCFIKLDVAPTQPLEVPFVKDFPQTQEALQEYEEAVYSAQGAISGTDVDELVSQNEMRFLALASVEKAAATQERESPPIKKRRGARKSLYATIK